MTLKKLHNSIGTWLFLTVTLTVTGQPLLDPNSPMPDVVLAFNETSPNRTRIVILSELNYGPPYGLGPIATESQRIALERLRRMPNWLPNYDIQLEMVEDFCDDSVAVGEMINRLNVDDDAIARFPLAQITECRVTSQQLVAELIGPYHFVGVGLHSS